MAHCTNCHTEIFLGDKVCPVCGIPIANAHFYIVRALLVSVGTIVGIGILFFVLLRL